MGCTTTPTFIDRLKLTFAAAEPPPCHVFEQVALTAAEENIFVAFLGILTMMVNSDIIHRCISLN